MTFDNGETWSEVQKLIALDGAPANEYGYWVSMSGDVLAVTAWRDDDNGSNSGIVMLHSEICVLC